MTIRQNVGQWDRLVRLVSGSVSLLVGAAGVFPTWTSVVLAGAGVLLIVTGVLRYCPLYSVVGFSTRGSRAPGGGARAG